MWTLPLLLCVKLRSFITGAVPNPPNSGKDALKGSVPMVTSNLREAGYEEDFSSW